MYAFLICTHGVHDVYMYVYVYIMYTVCIYIYFHKLLFNSLF